MLYSRQLHTTLTCATRPSWMNGSLQLMILQMQFLGTLIFVETSMGEDFEDLLDELKWLNLYFGLHLGFRSCSSEARFRVCRKNRWFVRCYTRMAGGCLCLSNPQPGQRCAALAISPVKLRMMLGTRIVLAVMEFM